MTAEKFDVYSHVTNQIVAQIEAGTPPWRKPWTGGGAGVSLPERFNGEAYRGINILMLWATAMAMDYSSARWMTFNQAKQLGGHVRKGVRFHIRQNTPSCHSASDPRSWQAWRSLTAQGHRC